MTKLLLFDLDETLIHVKRDPEDQDSEVESFEPEVELPVFDPESGMFGKRYFSIRPFARECLAFANKYFEVGVFTAGLQWFADPILNYLDPKGTFIQHRFYRQHCSLLGEPDCQFYTKDLTILRGIDYRKCLIVDNNIHSFALNLENGIPVHDFFGNNNDKALL